MKKGLACLAYTQKYITLYIGFFLMIIIHNARVHIYVASQFPKSQLGLNYIRFPFTVAMMPVCCAL